MKIVLVIATMSHGGAERVMSELANNWSNRGHEVILVLLAKGTRAYLLHKNIRVIELGFENPGILKRFFYELKVLFELRNFLRIESPDFVLSFMCKYNVFTLLSASFLNLNVYVSDRNNPKNKLPLIISVLRKLTYRYANGIVAQTSLAKETIEKQTGNKNIRVIANPLKNITLYPNITREKIILNIGRLDPQKGQKYLLEIFSKSDLVDWKLVILGSGNLLEPLQVQAKKLGIEDRVVFQGNVSDVDKWLARSSIFAFTSLYEGFPNALAEAMAAGLPSISFDCDTGPRELIKNEDNGFLVPLGDVKTFMYKINLLAEDSNIRNKLGSNAMNIRYNLKVDFIAEKYLEFCGGGK